VTDEEARRPVGTTAGSFERLYENHVWTVYGFIGYRTAQREEAEDLTQLTFERALKAWHRFDPARASESTWLLSIARNLVIDHYRRTKPESVSPEQLPEVEDEAADAQPNLGLDPALESALTRLSDRDREVIALRYGGDLTGAEIASVLGISLANVQQIISRSLRRLRDELGERPGSS
jgi:RNA polymerase sigma factor (sigma-70 family)